MSDPLDPADPFNVFLTEGQLEERWGAKKGYCAEQRAQGTGPKYTRFSPRMVRYRLAHVIEHEEGHTFESNAEELVARDEGVNALEIPAKTLPGLTTHKRSKRTPETVET